MGSQGIPSTMRAAVFGKAGNIKVEEIPVPEIQPRELLVKLVASSLCGSDLVPYLGYLGPQTEGLAGGHEGVGIVVKVGETVCSFKQGDRVGFLNSMRCCQSCKPCEAGEAQYCESGKLNQGFDFHGFLAGFAVVSPQFAARIADELPIERMCPMFCAGITSYHAVKLLGAPRTGAIGIFGLGGVGYLAVRFAQAAGFRIIGFDVAAAGRDAATKHGAEAVVDSSDEQKMNAVVDRVTEGQQLDGAIVAAGVPAAYESAIKLTGFGGTIVTVGVPRDPVSVSIVALVKKNLRLQGTQTGNPVDVQEMMQVAAEHAIIPEVSLHTLDEAPILIDSLAKGQLVGKTGILFRS